MYSNTTNEQIKRAAEDNENAPTVIYLEGKRHPVVVRDPQESVQEIVNSKTGLQTFINDRSEQITLRVDLITGTAGTMGYLEYIDSLKPKFTDGQNVRRTDLETEEAKSTLYVILATFKDDDNDWAYEIAATHVGADTQVEHVKEANLALY